MTKIELSDDIINKVDGYADTLPKDVTSKFSGIDAFIEFCLSDYIAIKTKWGK